MNRKRSIVYFLKSQFFWYDEEIKVLAIELKF